VPESIQQQKQQASRNRLLTACDLREVTRHESAAGLVSAGRDKNIVGF
jgi:hypothetical protein